MSNSASRRSDCPINFSLEMLGDTWSLLIIRDIVFAGKHTFGQFLAAEEGIARNILADRLLKLEQRGLLRKMPHPADKRKELYEITEKGLDLIPVLLELSTWGAKHEPETAASTAWIAEMGLGRDELISFIRSNAQHSKSKA